MERKELKFVVASAADITDYLILEAYIGDKFVAHLFNEQGKWEVDFVEWSMSWEMFTQIHRKFAGFVEEMKNYPVQ